MRYTPCTTPPRCIHLSKQVMTGAVPIYLYNSTISILSSPSQALLLRILRLSNGCFSPGRPSIPRLELPHLDLGPLRRSPNLPIGLSVHVSGPQLQVSSLLALSLLLLSLFDGNPSTGVPLEHQIRADSGLFHRRQLHLCSNHAEPPSAHTISGEREDLVPLEDNSNVLSLWMLLWILVVFDVSAGRRIYRMISSHCAVFAREPMCAALAEYNVAGNHILFCYFGNQLLSPNLIDGRNETYLRISWHLDAFLGHLSLY